MYGQGFVFLINTFLEFIFYDAIDQYMFRYLLLSMNVIIAFSEM